MYFNHSSMRKVHLVKGHVVYVYWIDTAYVQINLPTEIGKRTIFVILRTPFSRWRPVAIFTLNSELFFIKLVLVYTMIKMCLIPIIRYLWQAILLFIMECRYLLYHIRYLIYYIRYLIYYVRYLLY